MAQKLTFFSIILVSLLVSGCLGLTPEEEKAQSEARFNYFKCVQENSVRFDDNKSNIGDIVNTAIFYCRSYEDAAAPYGGDLKRSLVRMLRENVFPVGVDAVYKNRTGGN